MFSASVFYCYGKFLPTPTTIGCHPEIDMRRSLVCLALSLGSASALKRILVTGANKGIGREICRRLIADHPDCAVILGSRSVARGEAAVEAILKQEPSAEGRLEWVPLDVEDDDSVAAAVETIVERHGATAPLFGCAIEAGTLTGPVLPCTAQLC